jgi:hypothetical protein
LAGIGAGVAIGGGLLFGVATAAPAEPAEVPGAATPTAGATPSRPPPGIRRRPRAPLHRLLLARLRGETPAAAASNARVLIGRLVRLGPDGAVVLTLEGPRQVRVTPRTRLPARRPRPGDGVLLIGRSLPDGTFEARAVMARAPRAR